MRLEVWMDNAVMGWLAHDIHANQYAFEYSSDWLNRTDAFALCPSLPLIPIAHSTEAHSRAVRTFFENLLPEGQALDDVSILCAVSKTSVLGLLAVIGGESAGALRIVPPDQAQPAVSSLRPVPWKELSERIQKRREQAFSIWDQKVRLSIAGYQDKLAVHETAPGEWALADGPALASTHILKPDPLNPQLAGLTSNEFYCMRLAQAAGLAVAPVTLWHIPEPVLLIERFDRLRLHTGAIQRQPVIDGCQALGLAVAAKYERPHGDGRDVREYRAGASLPKLFEVLKCSARPALERLALLRWVIFQVLISNTDAHAKNLSFKTGPGGLSLAPAYDLVCAHPYADLNLADTYAMAIGDAFDPAALCAYEWANFAKQADIPVRLLQHELTRLIKQTTQARQHIGAIAVNEGAEARVVHAISEHIGKQCKQLSNMVQGIAEMWAYV